MKEKETVKRIKIFTESGPMEILDLDNSSLEEYTKNLSSILESSKVSILETSTGNLVLRPSKITGLLVVEEKVSKEPKKSVKVDKVNEDILMEED